MAVEVTVQGDVLSSKGTQMSRYRISAVLAMPFPRSAKNMRRYLRLVNFMKRHIARCADSTNLLSQEVNEPVATWPVVKMLQAFEELQVAVDNQLSLAHLNYSKNIVVFADVSALGVGGCLYNLV